MAAQLLLPGVSKVEWCGHIKPLLPESHPKAVSVVGNVSPAVREPRKVQKYRSRVSGTGERKATDLAMPLHCVSVLIEEAKSESFIQNFFHLWKYLSTGAKKQGFSARL